MKMGALILILTFTTTACVTAIPLSSQETCSLENMTTGGVNIGSESGVAMASSYGQNNVFVNSRSESRSVLCRPAQSDNEKCDVKASRKATAPKDQFNSGIGFKRFLVGTGYFLWIVPGMVANWYYEGEKSQAMREASNTLDQEITSCEKAARLPTTK